MSCHPSIGCRKTSFCGLIFWGATVHHAYTIGLFNLCLVLLMVHDAFHNKVLITIRIALLVHILCDDVGGKIFLSSIREINVI